MSDRCSSLSISPIRIETLPAVAALEQECFSSPWSREALLEELRNPHAVFLVAQAGGEVVGYAGMHHILDEGYITNIAVGERFRRMGVATALLDALLVYAHQNAMQLLTLEVRASNHAALCLYRRFGFEQVGMRRNYYTKPTEDALLLTRKL